MNNIDALIEQYCPNGVKFKKMGEFGVFIRGNGLQKKDFTETGIGCIHYGQIYTYYGTFAHKTKTFVSLEFAKKLRKAQKGDLVIATTSENVADVCKTVAWLGDDEIAVSGDAYIYKHNQNPKFLAYYLQTPMFFDHKKKNVTGTKVIRVSGNDMAKFKIPIPPLAIQQEIVTILDKFTSLQAELQAELQARRAQYEYYRNELLNFEGKEVDWRTLGEVSRILRGTAITRKETISGKFPVVANSPNPIYFHGKSNRSGETIVIARSGAYSGLVSYWNKPFFLTDAFSIHPDNTLFETKFVYYLLKREQEKIHLMKKGSGVPHVRAKDFESYSVPMPPLVEQNRIVAILDKFDKLVNDISEGLPAEIEARRKQFEYYRGKLLTFKGYE